MRIQDHLRTGLRNLLRTKVRSILTILGVVIGIGSLASMISFGTGMQKNLTNSFTKNDLFTSLRVTRKDLNPGEMGSIINKSKSDSAPPLNARLVKEISAIPGVRMAYPEISFPARISYHTKEQSENIRALPSEAGLFPPWNLLAKGTFFQGDTLPHAVISIALLRDLGLLPPRQPNQIQTGTAIPDSILGQTLTLSLASISSEGLGAKVFGITSGAIKPSALMGEKSYSVKIIGVMEEGSSFGMNFGGAGLVVPSGWASKIPRLDFVNVWDLLDRQKKKSEFSSIYVRFENPSHLESIRQAIEKMNLHVFSFADQLKDIRKSFLLINGLLGAIGAIALIVAALGIMNTMLMSVLERTREIGILKSVGAGDSDIRRIFFVEAFLIGLAGGILGLILGYGVTRIANLVLAYQMNQVNEAPVDLFYFPAWLILGAIAFSIVISLLSGLAPAIKASRTDPVKALRHD